MKKFVFASAVAAAMLYAPLAQAATVYDLTFTGFFAASGSPSQVDGTGTITTTGGTGFGFENATLSSSGPKITDIQINLGAASFDFADAIAADLATFNGNPLSFGYLGVDPAGAGFFDPKMVLTAYFGTDKFTLADGEGKPNFFIGNFSISPGVVAGVPEPATWAMLLLGFGGIGAMLRMARRKQDALAAA
jgi:hypothetical protein